MANRGGLRTDGALRSQPPLQSPEPAYFANEPVAELIRSPTIVAILVACAGLARIVNGSSIFWILIAKPNASLTAIIGGAMQTVEITNPKVARRCRYAQYRGEQVRLMLNGAPVTGMIRAVMEDRSSIPKRWTVTLISKKGIAA